MKKILPFILLTVICLSVYGQDKNTTTINRIVISLKVIYGDSSWFQESLYPRKVNIVGDYKFPGNYLTYSISAVILNRAQEYYERLHEGKMSAGEFSNLPKIYNIDTAILYKGKLRGNHINVFTAIDSVNKYVIVDANNNNSFLDDRIYTFPLNNHTPRHPKLNVVIKRFDGDKKTVLSVPVSIDAFDYQYGTTELEKSLEISLTAGSMRVGKIQVNGKNYLIGLNNRNFGLEASNNTDYSIFIRESPQNKNDINDYHYRPSDSLDIGGNIYKIQQVTDQSIVLNFIKKNDNGSGRLNTLAPVLELPDVITNKPYRLNLNSGKYTVIDFWGSWCAPCIEELPLLIDTHTKFSGSVNFVNIALDYDENIGKLKNLITQNKLNWPQLRVDRRQIEGSPVFDYKVDHYPTTILLDKNGKIIYRGIGSGGLENIRKMLDTMADQNK